MPLPLVLAAPSVANGVALLVGGVVLADSVNQSLTNNANRGYSDNYSQQPLGGFDTVPNLSTNRPSNPPENPVWDGRSTGTGALSDQLADSRRTSLRDSYMPLVGTAPSQPQPPTRAQGRSSSVPTPRGREKIQDKLLPQLGSASDLFRNTGNAISNSVATAGRLVPRLPNFPFFLDPENTKKALRDKQQREAQQRDNSRVDNAGQRIGGSPPFTGGQMTGVDYAVYVKATYPNGFQRWSAGVNVWDDVGLRNLINAGQFDSITGAITGISVGEVQPNLSRGYSINGVFGVSFPSLGTLAAQTIEIIEIQRVDNQPDTGGDPSATEGTDTNKKPQTPAPSPDNWYYGNVPVNVGGKALEESKKLWEEKGVDPFKQPTVKPFPQKDPIPTPDPVGSKPTQPPVSRQPNGFPQIQPQEQQQNTSQPTQASRPVRPPQGGFISTPATQTPVTQTYANGMTNEMYNSGTTPSFNRVEPNSQPSYNTANQVRPNQPSQPVDNRAPNTTPTTPTTSNPNDGNFGQTIASILGLTALVTALKIGSDAFVNASLPKIDNINNNTSPQAQQANAKEGVCQSMQPNQCGFEGVKQATTEATNPIKSVLDNLANILAPFIAFAQTALGKILNILNNTVIDRSLAVMNLATNIHNAAMLTRDIGETLGSVVDNVISLTGLRFTNSEGSQVQFTDFIGANFRSFLVSVLGVENYTSLVLNWQKANTIYHSAMAVVNTTQSMIDPISSAVEYGMENVSKIGNSLKEDGVVGENAYPAMDETIRARRVNRFERLNDTLEGAENIASNLSSITSSAVSVKEDYKQLREDSKELRDKANAFNTADLEARAALKAKLPTEITAITLAPAPAEDEE
ncbi:hypothetical protein [Pseudanabaena mucicola]|uniref:Uncharacterized protein n=1 Tax=Pseudanabaena mucicola FACHB-723 TaxID=2692860 RepID=A0ABR8A0V4_9CYAN|nr:hypothetical protein [Pseudanabaena mucicola]MBD2189861.1 hypothetical protein [Pseudanabaena mucicola FACHB-723]